MEFLIDQFRYIKIQPQTIDLRSRLWGTNTEFVEFIPQSLVLRSFVLGWILIYRNWSIVVTFPRNFTSQDKEPIRDFYVISDFPNYYLLVKKVIDNLLRKEWILCNCIFIVAELYERASLNFTMSVIQAKIRDCAINAALWYQHVEIKIAWTRKKFSVVLLDHRLIYTQHGNFAFGCLFPLLLSF